MSYKYYVVKRAPMATWNLDDTIPFFELSGSGMSATKKTGTSDPTTSTPLVAGAAFSSVFKSTSVGKFTCPLFAQGREAFQFALEAWILPIPKTSTGDQQILSHDGIYDGLTINGKVIKFTTKYLTAADASCSFDLQEYKAAHVVGIHNVDQNQLWVNGKMVASVDLTDAQKADRFVATDGFLYSGFTASTQELAMNGVSFYPTLSGDQIAQNYSAGTNVVPQAKIAHQLEGLPLNMTGSSGNIFVDRTWDDITDFNLGLKNLVEYSAEQIIPSYDSGGLSVAGTWTTAVPLDSLGYTSIYGVLLTWSGIGITVDTSLDGTTWTAATNGSLIAAITSGYNPTGKDLQIRVNFASGQARDLQYLDSLRVIGYKDSTFDNPSARTVTSSWPAVLRGDFEPIYYRDDNGINLKSATLTIGTDTTSDPQVARTLEMWIKVISGTPTISVGGTKYRNGVADSTLPVGEWSLIHYVAAADITTTITVTGDCIVGQVVLYPTALTAGQVTHLFQSYTGTPAISISDPGTIAITEPAVPTNIYAHDWSISSAG